MGRPNAQYRVRDVGVKLPASTAMSVVWLPKSDAGQFDVELATNACSARLGSRPVMQIRAHPAMADGYRLPAERLVHPRFCWMTLVVVPAARWSRCLDEED